jgi:hypothetical protein
MMSSTRPTPPKNDPVPPNPAPGSDPSPQSKDERDKARERQERQLDEALEDTFPASDPIALSEAR